ncbi:MAG: hypothetical protein IK123_02485 [Lachnospiraceae bacterium]|nr:hypothetical protein [Lachnospiraceae bacterium]
MKLIVLQVTVLILAICYMLIGAGEKDKIGRITDLVVGMALFVLLYISILLGGA